MAKTALVTGASGGIGAAIAKKLAKCGYNVVVNYQKNEDGAKKVADTINLDGGNAVCIRCDVSDSGQVKDMFAKISATFGTVSLLVNNAGISHSALFTDTTEEEWDRVFDINVKGMFLCSKEALADMISAKDGKIINISSMWGVTGASCEVAYSASKSAVIGFTKALAKEVGPSGIRVNCVAPGVIQTPMLSDLGEDDLKDLEYQTPLLTLGASEDIANAVAFLASAEADFITGEVLNVNGGFVI